MRDLINRLRDGFTIRSEFRQQMESTEFLSKKHLGLNDIFVFSKTFVQSGQ